MQAFTRQTVRNRQRLIADQSNHTEEPDVPPPSSTREARRWPAPWRSPADQPRWARPALLGIAAVAGLLYAWNIADSKLSPFYPVAVRSMSASWKAFWFGAVDPAASITIDKIPGFLWPQALSVRAFGFHPWAIALPQVVEGVIAVLVLYRVVRRWAGAGAGLLAAGIFATTPILASLFGHAMEDAALTVCLVLAADAWQRAAASTGVRPLLLSGVWVGLGFQAKMLQAWAVLPAFAIAYLVVAPASLRRRTANLALAAVVTVAVSAFWMVSVALTPTADRPYIDGTTNNSVVAMVVGYNGLGRFGPVHISGAIDSGQSGATSAVAKPAGAAEAGPLVLAGQSQTADSAKLLRGDLATQIGWLYPPAALALAFGLWWRRRAPRTDTARGGLLMWGLWLAVTAAAFSAGNVPHPAYTAALAAPLAALSAYGIVVFYRAYRQSGPRSWALPVAAAATVAWATYLSGQYGSFLPWLAPTVLATGTAALAALAAARVGRLGNSPAAGRVTSAALVAAVVAMLASPAAWAASTLDTKYDGTPTDAAAGPVGSGLSAGLPVGANAEAALVVATNPTVMAAIQPTGVLTAPERGLLGYLEAHRDGARYLFATTSWTGAAPFILGAAAPVLPMAGFTGTTPFPSLTDFQRLVSTGQLHYVLVTPSLAALMSGSPDAVADNPVTAWVTSHCALMPIPTVDSRLYGCSSGNGG